MPFDLENNNDISVTDLDLERLKDLEENGRVDGECGAWVCFKYKRDYLLTVDTDRIHKIFEFKTLEEIISCLKKF
ncbi:MAG: hypothetical protein AABY22_03135 [Nanoarchaeota archaeon]